MDKAIKVSAMLDFFKMAETNGWSDSFTLRQLRLFCKGRFQEQLHDNCIVLIDGTSKEFEGPLAWFDK